MQCPRCGNELNDDWKFCPACGLERGGNQADAFGRDLFSKLFKKMNMDKMFENDIQAIDLSPFFKKVGPRKAGMRPKGNGFTIRIKSGTGMRPKVNIQTLGDVNRETVEKVVQSRFGIRGKPGEMNEERRKSHPAMERAMPKVTEEPKADVKRIGGKFTVDVEMPEVKNPDEVEIRELASSVEVKAVTGDKAYFKILTKPHNVRLSGKSFRDGILHLEFS